MYYIRVGARTKGKQAGETMFQSEVGVLMYSYDLIIQYTFILVEVRKVTLFP